MSRVVLGWREQVALPELRAEAVLAKLDTGAYGSVVHATEIVLSEPPETVRFVLHPWPERPEAIIPCIAALHGQRAVTSSNGASETRPVIRTVVRVGSLSAVVEVSLTGRPLMRHRLLLGRAALCALGVAVDPAREALAR